MFSFLGVLILYIEYMEVGDWCYIALYITPHLTLPRYLVTFSAIVDDPNSPQNIIVWEIRTGKKKRSFLRGNAEDWPILK